MHKFYVKINLWQRICRKFGIKVPKSLLVFAHSYTKEILANFEYPIIIKPNYESESIGITQNSIVENMEQADMALKQLMKDFDGILVGNTLKGESSYYYFGKWRRVIFWRSWTYFSRI